jgi:hypothetical protein
VESAVTYRLYVKKFIEGAADALAERLLAQARAQQLFFACVHCEGASASTAC